MGQPVASSSRTPIYEQPNPLAEHPQERLSPFSNPSHLTLSQVPNQGELAVILGQIILTTLKTPFSPLRIHFPPTMTQRLPNVRLPTLHCLCRFLRLSCYSS